MTFIENIYHSLACNARIANATQPTCGFRSDGMWHDREAMLAEAKGLGWTESGRGHLCPEHSRQAAGTETAAVEAPAARKPRRKADTTVEPQVEQHDDNGWQG